MHLREKDSNVNPVLVWPPLLLEGWKVLGGQDVGKFFALTP